DCGERRYRSVQYGRGAVVACLSFESAKRRAHRTLPLHRPRAQIGGTDPGFHHADRCDSEISHAAAGSAEARVYGGSAGNLEATGLARAARAAALAWLFV